MCTKLAVKEKEMYVNCRGASRSHHLCSVFCEYDQNEIVFCNLVAFKSRQENTQRGRNSHEILSTKKLLKRFHMFYLRNYKEKLSLITVHTWGFIPPYTVGRKKGTFELFVAR